MPISAKESLEKLGREVANCTKCTDLVKTRLQPVTGSGASNANIMIVGINPIAEGSEKSGIPFSGYASGELIRQLLEDNGLNPDRDVYLTYIVKCTPGKGGNKSQADESAGAKPSKKHEANCINYLIKEISIITPHIIVSLGLDASNIILDSFFSIDKKYRSMEKIHMRVFENPSFKLVPFFSPNYVTETGEIDEDKYRKDFGSLSGFLKIV